MESSADWEHAADSSRPIQVVLRVRPLQPHEVGHKSTCVQADGETAVVTLGATGNHGMGTDRYMRNFAFDSVLLEGSTQADLFQLARVREMLAGVMNGFHATVFAYGQTGSGKTHCMEGFKYKRLKVTKAEGKTMEPRAVFDETPPERLGIVPRAVHSLFESIKRNPERRHSVKVSYVQIYKEQVYDLLNIASFRGGGNAQRSSSAGLRMRWSRNQQFYLENVYKCECKSAHEVLALYQSGINNKFMASHKMNAQSSRSHTLFVLEVDSAPVETPEEVVSSKMTFVDLAGSERGSSAGSLEGKLQQESIAINKSLFALRKVITALADGKSVHSPHIPFRDSKLTSLLKHSLGGSSLTTMISCIAPSDEYYEENLSTLEYSSRARAISNQLVRNEDPKTKLIRELRNQVAFLQGQLQSTPAAEPSSPHIAAVSAVEPTRAAFVERDSAGAVSDRVGGSSGGGLPSLEEVAAARRMDDAAVSGATDHIQQMLLDGGVKADKVAGRAMGVAWGQEGGGTTHQQVAGQQQQQQQRSKEEVVKQVELMGRYLLQSMTVLKQVASTNQQLRQAYVKLYKQHEAGQALNDKLMVDNAELTDKVSMLESVVSCSYEDTPSGQAGTTLSIHTPSSATLVELDNLRHENKLLREWCQNEQRDLPPGVSSRKGGGASRGGLHRSASARPSRGNLPASSPSPARPGAPQRAPSDHRRSSSGNSGLMSLHQIEAVLSGSEAGRTRSPAAPSSQASGSGRGKRMSQGSSIPAYMMPGVAGRGVEGRADTGNYSYSAASGQALRISTTGKLLPTASGMVSSPWSGARSPATSASNGGAAEDELGVSADPQKRLGELFSSRNSMLRARLAGSSGCGSS